MNMTGNTGISVRCFSPIKFFLKYENLPKCLAPLSQKPVQLGPTLRDGPELVPLGMNNYLNLSLNKGRERNNSVPQCH